MFSVGLPEFAVLLIVAVFVFGPDKLPDLARQAGRMVRTLREFAGNARSELRKELGPEFSDLDVSDLNPRTLVQKHVLGAFDGVLDDDDDADVAVSRPTPRRWGDRPLAPGEQPPYDRDAT
jgi:sec-independent protein translocase protein TatB